MADDVTVAPSLSSYRDYQAEAHELVTRLIRSSLEKIAAEQSQRLLADESAKEPVNWPSGKEVTVEKGLEAIDQFVKVGTMGST